MLEVLRKIARYLLRAELDALQTAIQQREEAIQTLAHALTYITTPPERSKVSKPLRLKRGSYADEQWNYEWGHNKRAQEILQKAKLGIF